jgi:hypothetical protein
VLNRNATRNFLNMESETCAPYKFLSFARRLLFRFLFSELRDYSILQVDKDISVENYYRRIPMFVRNISPSSELKLKFENGGNK